MSIILSAGKFIFLFFSEHPVLVFRYLVVCAITLFNLFLPHSIFPNLGVLSNLNENIWIFKRHISSFYEYTFVWRRFVASTHGNILYSFLLQYPLARNILRRYIICAKVKNTLKAFDDFKNKQKSVWSNVFLYVKVYIFWKFVVCLINYTFRWNRNVKKKSFRQINLTKIATFLLLRAPARFTFNVRFLYELKRKVRLFFSVWDFLFSIRFCFY